LEAFPPTIEDKREKKGKAKGSESCLQPVTLTPVDLPQGNVTD